MLGHMWNMKNETKVVVENGSRSTTSSLAGAIAARVVEPCHAAVKVEPSHNLLEILQPRSRCTSHTGSSPHQRHNYKCKRTGRGVSSANPALPCTRSRRLPTDTDRKSHDACFSIPTCVARLNTRLARCCILRSVTQHKNACHLIHTHTTREICPFPRFQAQAP